MMPLLYSLLYVLAIGIAAHVIGEAIPATWFHHDRFPYRTWHWERGGRIYERIGIRRWKERMPDMSRIVGYMVPKRVGIAPHAEQVWRFVTETCRAEAVHWGLCFLSPVVCLFWGNAIGWLCTALIVLGNLPFILIQRYNRPMLVALARRLDVREERKRRHENSHSIG